jgi:hypothetical protein
MTVAAIMLAAALPPAVGAGRSEAAAEPGPGGAPTGLTVGDRGRPLVYHVAVDPAAR